MNRIFSRLGFTAVAIIAGSGIAAHAQSTTTGGVFGHVRDDKGTPVAGVTLTLSSTQITRIATSGPDGTFRVGLLNAGEWSVTLSKTGVATITQKIRVQNNENREVNFQIAAQLSATVEVLSTTGSIDPTTTTQGLNVTMESLSAVPTGRSMNDIINLSPGVVAGSVGDPRTASFKDASMGGGSAAENQYIVDGLITTDFRRGFQGTQLVTDFIDQVEVQTGGYKPEYSALGGVFNVTTKSGSNMFVGSAWATWDATGLHATAKKNTYFQEPGAPERFDIGTQVSGPLIKDKLFYFIGIDSESSSNTPVPNYNGFQSTKSNDPALQVVGKLNYFMTPESQLVLSFNHNENKHTQDYSVSTVNPGPGNIGLNSKNTVDGANLTWLWIIDPTTTLNTRVGYNKNTNNSDPAKAGALIDDRSYWATNPDPLYPTAQASSYYTAASGGGEYNHETLETKQFQMDLSKYIGNHQIKAGISYLTADYQADVDTTGGEMLPLNFVTRMADGTPDPDAQAAGLVPYRYTINASQSRAYLRIYSDHDHGKTIQSALYLQDTWEMSPGLRLAYGFRWEQQTLQGNNGQDIMKFNNFKDYAQPRVGLTWDVNNDGKTKLTANYGRYFESVPLRLAIRSYGNENYFQFRFPLTYNPSNPNGVGTINYAAPYASMGWVNYSAPFTNDPIADGTKLPKRDEFTFGVDHTLDSKWTVGLHYKYRKLTNIIEDSSLTLADGATNLYNKANVQGGGLFGGEAAAGAILWNPGSHASFKTDPSSIDYKNGIKSYDVSGLLFPEAYNTYTSADVTLSKATDRWSINMSVVWSKLYGNYEGIVQGSNGQADGNITSLFDAYQYIGTGLLPNDHTWVAKSYGSYKWNVGAGDLTLGYNLSWVKGSSRTFFAGGALDTGTPSPYPDPLGYLNATPHNNKYGTDGSNPDISNLDLTCSYSWKATKKVQVTPSISVFNALNGREAMSYQDTLTSAVDGSKLPYAGMESSWQEGRRVRFGVKVTF